MNQGIEILTKTHSRTLRRKESRKERREGKKRGEEKKEGQNEILSRPDSFTKTRTRMLQWPDMGHAATWELADVLCFIRTTELSLRNQPSPWKIKVLLPEKRGGQWAGKNKDANYSHSFVDFGDKANWFVNSDFYFSFT